MQNICINSECKNSYLPLVRIIKTSVNEKDKSFKRKKNYLLPSTKSKSTQVFSKISIIFSDSYIHLMKIYSVFAFYIFKNFYLLSSFIKWFVLLKLQYIRNRQIIKTIILISYQDFLVL